MIYLSNPIRYPKRTYVRKWVDRTHVRSYNWHIGNKKEKDLSRCGNTFMWQELSQAWHKSHQIGMKCGMVESIQGYYYTFQDNNQVFQPYFPVISSEHLRIKSKQLQRKRR